LMFTRAAAGESVLESKLVVIMFAAVAQAIIYSFCLIFMALGTQVPCCDSFALKTGVFMLLNHILFGIFHIIC
jgi:hypothetical protein